MQIDYEKMSMHEMMVTKMMMLLKENLMSEVKEKE